uniref:Uncharacterized protein n=1 Tax=Rhizophora mucronata TaxID=61149 RepID=A0A2P2QY24_RHIMU
MIVLITCFAFILKFQVNCQFGSQKKIL